MLLYQVVIIVCALNGSGCVTHRGDDHASFEECAAAAMRAAALAVLEYRGTPDAPPAQVTVGCLERKAT